MALFRTKSEKYLATFVFILILAAVGYTVYNKVGDDWSVMQADVEERKEQITALQKNKEKKVSVEKRYNEMISELKLEGSDSEQKLRVREIMTEILNEIDLEGNYKGFKTQDPEMLEDFKVISVSITQLECTPAQLGRLLYRIERESEVMEITFCQIDNQMNDIGQISQYGRSQNLGALDVGKGLLQVDLEVARLVEYKPGEAPERSSRTRS